MQFALMTEPQLGMTYETMLELARFAQTRGLAAFARSDHYSFDGVEGPHATDAFATLAGLARETERIDLVVLVSPITFRHPAVLAKMAATIDEMSAGRLVLGVGTGWMALEHSNFGIDFHEGRRFALLEEALAYLHHAFGRRPGPFHGDHFTLEETRVFPRPTGQLPIVIGGSGEHRTPRLAGTYGDEYNFGIRPADAIKSRIDRARSAAVEAGRDPDKLRISVMTPVIAGVSQAGFDSNAAAIAAADPWGRSADDLIARYRDRGLPVGTAEEVQDVVGQLADLDVDRIYLQHFGPYQSDLLDETFTALGA